MPESARRSLALAALVLLALLGVADGVYLTHVHLEYLFDPESMRGSVCHQLSTTGCTVTVGEFGSIRGVPISIIGMAGCFTLVVLAAAAWRRRKLVHDPLRAVLLLLSTFAVLASVIMAGLSWFQGAYCPFCVAWYGINIGMLICAYVARDRANNWQDNFDESLGSTGFLAMAIFTSALLAGLWAYHEQGDARQAQAEQDLFAHAEEIARAEFAEAKKQAPLRFPLDDAPLLGPVGAKVEIVEFSDFECPYCQKLWASTEEVIESSEIPVRLRFVHFPLNAACNPLVAESMHPNACTAAIAAECAARQNKFWDYGSVLFQNQQALERDDLLRYAEQTGLQTEAFEQCLDDPASKAAVVASAKIGATADVSGTPTFFINGYRFVGSRPAPILKALVEIIAEEGEMQAAPATLAVPTQAPAAPSAEEEAPEVPAVAPPAEPAEPLEQR